MLQQLNPPLPMTTPRGPGLAHFVSDDGPEANPLWVVLLDASGECWTAPNPEVRFAADWSLRRRPRRDTPGPAAGATAPGFRPRAVT